MELELNVNDLSNLRKLLDRVQVNGSQEATVLVVLCQKLEGLIAKEAEKNGEDVPRTD